MNRSTRTAQDIKDLLSNMPLDELYEVRGKYCGPHNLLKARKRYGLGIPLSLVEEELFSRMLEEELIVKTS